MFVLSYDGESSVNKAADAGSLHNLPVGMNGDPLGITKGSETLIWKMKTGNETMIFFLGTDLLARRCNVLFQLPDYCLVIF